MDYQGMLEQLIEKNDGMISVKEASAAGIPRIYIGQLVKQGILEKIERGIYLAKNGFDDEMYRLQHKYPVLIYSHVTALFLHDLTDRDPLRYMVTVPAGYNSQRIKDMGIKVFSIKMELLELGLCSANTIFGKEIKTYDSERTICDILRSRRWIDVAIVSEALKRYVKRKDKNIPQLMRYSEYFKISKLLGNYLEVLL